MKTKAIYIIIFSITFSISIFAQDVDINILAINVSGNSTISYGQGCTGRITVSVCNNDGGNTAAAVGRLEPVISLPSGITVATGALVTPNASWALSPFDTGNGQDIRVTNTEAIPVADCREFEIEFVTVNTGGPENPGGTAGAGGTVVGSMMWLNGGDPPTGIGPQTPGNNPANDNSTTSISSMDYTVMTSTDNCAASSSEVEFTISGGRQEYTITGFPNSPLTVGTTTGLDQDFDAPPTTELTTGVNMAGDVDFTVTDANGCSIMESVTFANDCPLPVELITFTGKAQDCATILNWSTATEINNSHFEVEHSINGKQFYPVAKVNGRGTTLEEQQYQFRHEDVLVSSSNYYRLRQVDFDGAYEYSKVIAVEMNCKNTGDLKVYPSPLDGTQLLTVDFYTENAETQFSITNTNGQHIRQINSMQFESGNHQLQIDVSTLPTGVYFLSDEKGNTVRFIVE